MYVQGSVTGEDVYNVLPFNNTVDLIQLTGAQLKDVLEDAVLDFCPDQTCEPEHFYQVRFHRSSLHLNLIHFFYCSSHSKNSSRSSCGQNS